MIRKYKNILVVLIIVVMALATGYFLFHGTNSFSRRGVRQMRVYIQSFGIFSPVAVGILIVLSTVIPPLPLPVPLVELAAGVAFGFINGSIVVWVSQIVSSVLAFYIAKLFRKKIVGLSIIKDKRWIFYKSYLEKKGAFAIFLIRFAMAAPFNIVSYLAGLTQMKIESFIVATALGTIPESLLYTFIGSQIRTLHIKLVYLSLLVAVIGCLGFVFTLIFLHVLQNKKREK
jgi:uncharacterized membrane protein YdjX (TVP38/TMEM64 family)